MEKNWRKKNKVSRNNSDFLAVKGNQNVSVVEMVYFEFIFGFRQRKSDCFAVLRKPWEYVYTGKTKRLIEILCAHSKELHQGFKFHMMLWKFKNDPMRESRIFVGRGGGYGAERESRKTIISRGLGVQHFPVGMGGPYRIIENLWFDL